MLSANRLLPALASALVTSSLLLGGCAGPTTQQPSATVETAKPTISSDALKLEQLQQRYQDLLRLPASSRSDQLVKLAQEIARLGQAPASQVTEGSIDVAPLLGDVLAAVDPLWLSQQTIESYRLLSAELLASNGEKQWGLAYLKAPFQQLTDERLIQAYQLRAELQHLSAPLEAANDRLVLSTLLTDNSALQENERQLLAALNSLTTREINEALNQSQAPAISRTLEFLAQVKATRNPQQLMSLSENWRGFYPDLPLSDRLINDYLKQRQSFFYQPKNVAVLLPLTGKLSTPGTMVQQGMLANYFDQKQGQLKLRFYDTQSRPDNIWQQYQRAIDEGADIIVGPLHKQAVDALSRSESLAVPTLALNQSRDQGAKQLYQFALSPEQEAALAATQAWHAGHRHAALLVPEGNWGERMRDAFILQWQTLGGEILESQAYDAQQHDFSTAIKMLLNVNESVARKNELTRLLGQRLHFTPRRRQDIDMIFMAAYPRQARQIPSQVQFHHGEGIPIYATSHIVSGDWDANTLRDLEGVHFPDMPWLLGLTESAISEQNQASNITYKRLFSFGVDAFGLLPMLKLLAENPGEPFSGETGTLSIDPNGQIQRELPWMWVRNGRLRRDL